MPIATLTAIEKTFGRRVIFENLNLLIDRGERIGLIGANGAGKTTLFKLLTAQIAPDSGTMSIARSVKLGLLAQEPVFDSANTVMDEAELAFAELHRLSHRLRDIEHEMGDAEGGELDKILRQYQTVQHEFDLAGGYAWQHRLEATLLGIGLDRMVWEQNVSTLSGGQRSRLALAKLLISEPDILLLDEPTNHLDLAAIEWLEKYLQDFSGATVLISHDRYLLDRLATRIVWLTRQQLNSYPGNYSAFVQQRDLQELSQQRAYEQQQADIEKQKEFVRRFGAGQRAREAKGREKRLNRLLDSDKLIDAVQKQRHIHLSIDASQRAGDRVLSVRDLSKAYGPKTLWQSIGFEVARGQRIGIIGPNGSGKTTLLETLLGRRDADAGDVRWGANLRIGYYDQSLSDFDPDSTVMEEARGDRDVKDQDLRNTLGMLLFRGDDVHKPMSLLSGGERARVALAQLLLDKPNVLLLDEPTNHLDIPSREALENALGGFIGTIFCVSHDRYFLDRTMQRLLILRPPGIIEFEGTYSDWARRQRDQAEQEQRARQQKKGPQSPEAPKSIRPPTAQAAKRKADARDNPYARPFGRLSLKELERQITDTEVSLSECQELFSSRGAFKDPQRGQKLQAQYDELSAKLQELEAEYFAREQ